jgi:site-specific recombinase XerD
VNGSALVVRHEGTPATESDQPTAFYRLCTVVLSSVTSPHSKRNYAKAYDKVGKYLAAASQPLTRETFLRYREHLVERGLSASTINVQLSAIRKLVEEARRQGIIDSETAASLTDVPNIKQQGTRQGNWLIRAQAKELLGVPDRERLIGKRDHALLALLLGCGLRRQELAHLKVEEIVEREGRAVIVDLIGKGGRRRTVAALFWVKKSVKEWMAAAASDRGRCCVRSQNPARWGRGASGTGRSGRWSRSARRPSESKTSGPTTCDGRVPSFAGRPAVISNRSSSCSGIHRFRPQSASWGQTKGSLLP